MNLRSLLSWQPFTPAVFFAICAAAVFAVVIIVASIIHGQREAAQNKVDAGMGQARSESAADAMQTVERAHDAQAQSEALSRENEDAIRNAPGANQAVDPRVSDVARRRLCERASLRRTPECLQLIGPEKP